MDCNLIHLMKFDLLKNDIVEWDDKYDCEDLKILRNAVVDDPVNKTSPAAGTPTPTPTPEARHPQAQ
eukprot:scaffold16564_cov19-Prasinocladus_malaysianus.AAC.1